MNKLLLRIGGIINALFLLFHLWLGWSIWHWPQLAAGLRGLLETFNVGSALLVGFIVYASLGLTAELLGTKLGRSVCWLVILLYGTRAASEFVFSPQAKPAIAATCLAVAALYLAGLLLPAQEAALSSRPAAGPGGPPSPRRI